MNILNLFKTRKNYVLRPVKQAFWGVANLEVYHGDKLVHKVSVNKFWSVSDDSRYFRIHEADGGSGIGFTPGRITKSVYIGDGNYQELHSECSRARLR